MLRTRGRVALRRVLGVHPAVNRTAVRTVGRTQLMLDRRLSARGRWKKRAPDEIRFWVDALTPRDAAATFANRLDPSAEVRGSALRRALEEIEAVDVSILDVGSGPLSSVVGTYPGKNLTVVATDAFAEDYLRVLRMRGIEPPSPPIACPGEGLHERFGANSFDVVHIANALDHTADPLTVLENMLAVMKPAGRVALTHLPDEGERNQYMGIHLWNIRSEDDHLILWNRDARHDLTERLADRYELECWMTKDRVNCLIRAAAGA